MVELNLGLNSDPVFAILSIDLSLSHFFLPKLKKKGSNWGKALMYYYVFIDVPLSD